MTFVPIIGFFFKDLQDLQKTKDILFHYKNMKEEEREEVKIGLGGNLGANVQISLTDPALIKDFVNHETQYYVKSDEFADPIKILIE